jgi:hypothetical protein
VTRPLVKASVQALHVLVEEHRREEPAQPLVLVLTGPAGAGASTGALAFLHELAAAQDRIPAALHADLRQATGDRQPVDPGQVLGGWLSDLGICADRMPAGTAERAAWFRSLTQDGPLVLIDGAVSAAQVRPLLPGGSSVVVVTGRVALNGLVMNGARIVPFGPTPPGDPPAGTFPHRAGRSQGALPGHPQPAEEPGQRDRQDPRVEGSAQRAVAALR